MFKQFKLRQQATESDADQRRAEIKKSVAKWQNGEVALAQPVEMSRRAEMTWFFQKVFLEDCLIIVLSLFLFYFFLNTKNYLKISIM